MASLGYKSIVIHAFCTYLMQNLQHLKESMKVKFECIAETGVRIAFWLPDGSKTEHVFLNTSTVKVCVHFSFIIC